MSDLYNGKLTTAEEAIGKIGKSAHIWLHHCAMEPQALVRELVRQHARFDGARVYHMVRLGKPDITEPECRGHLIDTGLFLGGNSRAAYAEGVVDFVPNFFHESPSLLRRGLVPCEVALIQVTPPDANGYVSLGVSVDYALQAARTASLVVAQVNRRVPRTLGESFLHVSEIDWFVEADEDIYLLNPPKIGDEEKAIGSNCAELIEDGSTLQLGIGGIPDAVMLFLETKKDLGIHSEMISDGTLALFEKGVINNSKKSENRGRMTITFCMGTERLYAFVNDNPAVEVRPVDYVNHPVTVMRQHKPIGVNSAIEVDLMGQVNAETMGYRQFSGTGGQVDFVRGCSMAEGGKAIIAMPSSTVKKDGTRLSKIVPILTEGAGVTTLRTDVDYVVTEQGVAQLKGKTLRQRAQELIAVAHPDFRASLAEDFKKRLV
ncbi:MAG: 4-hydroxybutyrate CoA-transferase [Clostridiales Family XIII bacterium]|jgi:4-hydroxybutyrate CoA-transferase|nr:4-hydroxybutyrate CoA-transferase [Clostridiales Family XIII bacterium]